MRFGLILSVLCLCHVKDVRTDEVAPEVVYQWNIVEYEWPNATYRQQLLDSGDYIPQNSAINGIKLYKGDVYVTVPRLRPGVPSTLNVVVKNDTGAPILRPFPSWAMQALEDCSALQRVQSMEIDPHTGHMWIIDTGYRKSMKDVDVAPLGLCPPKLVIYDIERMRIVHTHTFPQEVAGFGLFYLNDIVLGFDEGKARYAYISDTLAYKLVVFDYLTDSSFSYSHPSMAASEKYRNLTIGNETTTIITGINGIAMSPDFKYLYYSAVAGVGLHQIKTSVVISARGDNNVFAANLRTLGEKVSPGDGMAYGSNHNLYYSALGLNAIYKWNVGKDAGEDHEFDSVHLVSHDLLVTDTRMEWVDTMTIDEDGYLWFTTSRLNKLFSEGGVQHHEPNFFVWRLHVGDRNYMHFRFGPTLGSRSVVASVLLIVVGAAVTWCSKHVL